MKKLKLDEELFKLNEGKLKTFIEHAKPTAMHEYVKFGMDFLLMKITLLEQEIKGLKNNGTRNSN